MSKPREKRRYGVIDDRRSYTIDDLKELGIGEDEQDAMRLDGTAPARMVSGRLRFMGNEINAWIRKQPVKEVAKKREKSVAG